MHTGSCHIARPCFRCRKPGAVAAVLLVLLLVPLAELTPASLTALLPAFCAWSVPSAHAESAPLPEYQVKAAFLFKFLRFVEWPGGAGSGAGAPLCIGVLGKDPFGKSLEAVQGKDPSWRRVVIRRFRRVEEVRECNLLFVSSSERGRLGQIVKQLQKAPVLTVGDVEGFCEAGGMINLVSARNRVSFEINVAAARNSGLKISSQLLRLARITPEEE